MPSKGAIKVSSASGALTVTFTVAASGSTPAVYSDDALTTAVTLPVTVGSGGTSTFYFATRGTYTLSVKTAGGVEIAADYNLTRTVDLEGPGQVAAFVYDARTVADIAGDTGYSVADRSAAYEQVLSGSMRAPRTVTFGDSITSQGGQTNGAPTGSSRGYDTWANVFLGERKLDIVHNAGVGGNTTAQMLARIATDVIAYTPDIVVVLGGTNDVSGSVASATTINNLRSIYQAISATGARVVACTVTPSDFINANGAFKLAAADINRWVRAYAQATRGVILCDWAGMLADAAAGNPIAAYYQLTSPNRVHPESDGAAVLGRVLADAVRPHIPPWCGRHQGLWDSDNLAPNSTFQGTAGTVTGSIGVTGTAPTSWTVFSSDGSSVLTAAVSVVGSADGVPANWAQLVLGPAASSGRDIHYSASASGFGTSIAIGDTYYWQVEVDADNDWQGTVGITADTYHGGGAAATDGGVLARSSSWANSTTNPCYDLAGSYTGPVLLRSHNITVPAGADRVQMELGLRATGGTIRFRRPEIRKVVAA